MDMSIFLRALKITPEKLEEMARNIIVQSGVSKIIEDVMTNIRTMYADTHVKLDHISEQNSTIIAIIKTMNGNPPDLGVDDLDILMANGFDPIAIQAQIADMQKKPSPNGSASNGEDHAH